MIYNYLNTDLSFLKNCKDPNGPELKNLVNNFLYLIHHKFNHKYKNCQISEILGGSNKMLFYTGVESDWEASIKKAKAEVAKQLTIRLGAIDDTSLRAIKIKVVSKAPQKTSILSILYIHSTTNQDHQQRDFNHYNFYYLFPIYVADLHNN